LKYGPAGRDHGKVALGGRTVPENSGKFNPIQVDSIEFNQNENKNGADMRIRVSR
jgi:hypothetical protein